MKNRILELKKEKEMSSMELATILDVTVRTAQRYQTGAISPPPEKLKIMADIFDCSIDYILYLSNERHSLTSDAKNELDMLLHINPLTKKTFVERIKDTMIQKEITKDSLSKGTKIDKELLTKYIMGQQFPGIDHLKRIAKRLNTTIDYLVGLNDDSDPNEIVILEDYVEFNDGEEMKKIPIKVIRDFLKSMSEQEDE